MALDRFMNSLNLDALNPHEPLNWFTTTMPHKPTDHPSTIAPSKASNIVDWTCIQRVYKKYVACVVVVVIVVVVVAAASSCYWGHICSTEYNYYPDGLIHPHLSVVTWIFRHRPFILHYTPAPFSPPSHLPHYNDLFSLLIRCAANIFDEIYYYCLCSRLHFMQCRRFV